VPEERIASVDLRVVRAGQRDVDCLVGSDQQRGGAELVHLAGREAQNEAAPQLARDLTTLKMPWVRVCGRDQQIGEPTSERGVGFPSDRELQIACSHTGAR
jgi:hypothetical protein